MSEKDDNNVSDFISSGWTPLVLTGIALALVVAFILSATGVI